MEFFLVIIYFLALIQTILNISFIEKMSSRLLICTLTAFSSYIFYYPAVNINFESFRKSILEKNFLIIICGIMIAEGLCNTAVSFLSIKSNYISEFDRSRNSILTKIMSSKSLLKSLIAFPSIVFLSGIFVVLTALFNSNTGSRFGILTLQYSFLIFTLLAVFSAFTAFYFRNFELHLELKILSSLFVIITAMFLPMLTENLSVSSGFKSEDFKTVFLVFLTLSAFMLIGFIRFLVKEIAVSKKIKG